MRTGVNKRGSIALLSVLAGIAYVYLVGIDFINRLTATGIVLIIVKRGKSPELLLGLVDKPENQPVSPGKTP